MSTTIHHAIIVTGTANEKIKDIHQYAVDLFSHCVTNMVQSCNSTVSFTVCPDGSNDGWPRSNEYDEARRQFVNDLKKYGVYFVEVEYGENGTAIINSSPKAR